MTDKLAELIDGKGSHTREIRITAGAGRHKSDAFVSLVTQRVQRIICAFSKIMEHSASSGRDIRAN